MKLKHSTYPALLGVFAAAVAIGGPVSAVAAVPEFQAAPSVLDQTDRLIVKYKDSQAAGKGAAKIANFGQAARRSLTAPASSSA
ncbi:hypothetical protein [Massilia cavernae]|uniref:Uncharacterized protein n=1 Tax=Massilia cavernae TaxID=2320864 RepID=A0A418XTR2_9BURK|nr:hypothetical protein [Massilia cavernae]RJG16072.1 hypothetical protein D3872_11285 [Massilia cavernae]